MAPSLISLAALLGGIITPLLLPSSAYAASGQLYMSPASGNVTQNSSFTVAVRVNTGGETINAVQANFSYPANLLQFISISGTNSAFSIAAPSSGGNGSVSIARAEFGGVTGDALVATVAFKAIAGSGSAALAFTAGSEADRTSDSKNIITSTNGATFTLQSSGNSTAPPPNTSNAHSTKTPTPAPTPPPPSPTAAPTSAPAVSPTTAENPAATPTPNPSPGTVSNNSTSSKTTADGKKASSNSAMLRISGLLIIAIAAVGGTFYFRRHHSALLAAPAGMGLGSAGMGGTGASGNPGTPGTPGAPLSASFRYGPPANLVNRFTGSATPTITPTVHAAASAEPAVKTSETPSIDTLPPSADLQAKEPSIEVKKPALVIEPISESSQPAEPKAESTDKPDDKPKEEPAPVAAIPTVSSEPTTPPSPAMPTLATPAKEVISPTTSAQPVMPQDYKQPEPVVIRPTAPVGDINKPSKPKQ